MSAAPDCFPAAFATVVGEEGGFDTTYADRGNWTGGAVESGELRGTKYGISAAAFPTLDIESLTLDAARDIYRALYWRKAGCDRLPAAPALIVFDAAVNNGVRRSVQWLQTAVGATADGLFGTATAAAVAATLRPSGGTDALCAELVARRLVFMASLSTWPTFALGWARRLAGLPIRALRMQPA